LFRFMLITQHGFLPRIPSGSRTPVDAIADLVGDAIARKSTKAYRSRIGCGRRHGVILQAATFHIYGRLADLWPPGRRCWGAPRSPRSRALAQ